MKRFKRVTTKVSIRRRFFAVVMVLCLMFCVTACGSSTATDGAGTDSGTEESVVTLGVLGTDFTMSELVDSEKGSIFTAKATYWSTRKDSYGYLFICKAQGTDGTTYTANIYAKDATDGETMAVLEEYSYSDGQVVQLTGTYDKTEFVTSGSSQITAFYMTVSEFTLLDETDTDVDADVEADVDADVDTDVDTEAQQSSTHYYYVGDTVTLDTGVSYTITAAGKYTDNQNLNYAYIELDILNESGEDIVISSSEVTFYGDNYRLDSGTPSGIYDKISYETISNGRQLSGRFYALCNDYDSLSVIEAEVGSVVVVIKDESTTTEQSESSTLSSEFSIYGTYEYDDGENGIMTAEIFVTTDDDESDYIYIEGLSYGDRYIASTEGYLEMMTEDTYHVVDAYGECELTLVFDEDGIYVTVEGASYEDLEILSGYYTKTGEIDWSQVG